MTIVLITLGFWRDLLRARRVDFWDGYDRPKLEEM